MPTTAPLSGPPIEDPLAASVDWWPVVFGRAIFGWWKSRARRVPLDEIHALQLLRERCHTPLGSFFSYELNLVLRDGERINVTDHGDGERLRYDAGRLARFLRVPGWGASDADAPLRPDGWRRGPRRPA